jgi:hypothetical protein
MKPMTRRLPEAFCAETAPETGSNAAPSTTMRRFILINHRRIDPTAP